MINFKRTNNTSVIKGTHGIAEINASYDKLVKTFGQPSPVFDDYKTDAEWDIDFNGTIATIYNYKDGQNYLGIKGLPVENITNWHIGGHSQRAYDYVLLALKS